MKIIKKINFLQKLVVYCMLVILFKTWYLTIFKKEEKLEEAKRPQRKTILTSFNRGNIYDRYNILLATNRIKYNASIYYSQIKQIPQFKWEIKKGKKEKKFLRKEYISSLSKFLSEELDLDEQRLKDLIYSKASLIPHIPFVIKENISEEKYYKLRMLEKDWVGLHAEISHERYYPQKRTASHFIGYLGAIDQKEYLSISEKIKRLKKILDNSEGGVLPYEYKNFEEVLEELKNIKEKAYSINDFIGKSGIEKRFEEDLRGFYGKKTFEIDVNGNFLKELKEEKPRNGKAINTTISSELQIFAEQLLAYEEGLREKNFPFIKGGAIVVMDPNNGDILTLASYPRYDPNDFISSSRNKNIFRWLEHPYYIANIWDGVESFKKEIFLKNKKCFFEKKTPFTFNFFLNCILPEDSDLFSSLEKIKNIKNAISLQENIEALLYFLKLQDTKELFDVLSSKRYIFSPKIIELKNSISPFLDVIKDNRDKALLVDLIRLLVCSSFFSDRLIDKIKDKTLDFYWDISKNFLALERKVKNRMKLFFNKKEFVKWREKNQNLFLKKKREEEKQKKRYHRPYLDLLDQKEAILFNDFWEKDKARILSSLIKNKKNFFYEIKWESKELKFLKEKLKDLDIELVSDLINTIKPFSELKNSFFSDKQKKIKELAKSFYPKNGFSFVRNHVFRQSAPLGSIFKIITSYASLKNHYFLVKKNKRYPKRLNPMTMIDIYQWDPKAIKGGSLVVGYSLSGKPYPKHYKSGRLISSINKNIGKIDIIGALSQSSNPYFSILAGDFLKDPEELNIAAKMFGIGKKTEIDLYGEVAGNLPKDLYNKTSLYSFAIGQHSLVTTPLQIAIMFSCLANKGKILKPKITKGKKEVLYEIFLPDSIRETILEGLDQVVWGEKGTARASVIKKFNYDYSLKKKYKLLKHQFVGKTSTAEIMHKNGITSAKAKKHNHSWFAGVSFDPNSKKWNKPELVVVVYLRFSSSGKEAAPIVSEIIHKYRNIKKKYKNFFD